MHSVRMRRHKLLHEATLNIFMLLKKREQFVHSFIFINDDKHINKVKECKLAQAVRRYFTSKII